MQKYVQFQGLLKRWQNDTSSNQWQTYFEEYRFIYSKHSIDQNEHIAGPQNLSHFANGCVKLPWV